MYLPCARENAKAQQTPLVLSERGRVAQTSYAVVALGSRKVERRLSRAFLKSLYSVLASQASMLVNNNKIYVAIFGNKSL